jgi:hypothetical protein
VRRLWLREVHELEGGLGSAEVRDLNRSHPGAKYREPAEPGAYHMRWR